MEKYKIKNLGTIISGGTPSTSNENYWDGNIIWITPKDLSKNKCKYIYTGERNISKDGLEHSSAKLLPKNAVLLSSRAPIGYLALAGCELTTNQGFKSIVCNESIILSEYLYYLLSTKIDDLISISSGSTFLELSKSAFENLELNIHNINEQQHIVDIIGSIDDLIESNNKLVLKLLSILNNKLEYLITKSTEFIPLKSIISERKERIGLNDVKLLSVVNTGELVLQDEYFDKNTASADMKKYKLIRKFDYAYNPARINIGSIGMLKENYLGAISPIYVVFEIDENYKYYLDFYKSSKYMRKYIEKKSSGSVRQNLPFDEFASIEIPNINTEFLKEFNSLCDLYYKKINDLKTKTIKLQAIKDQYLKKFFG